MFLNVPIVTFFLNKMHLKIYIFFFTNLTKQCNYAVLCSSLDLSVPLHVHCCLSLEVFVWKAQCTASGFYLYLILILPTVKLSFSFCITDLIQRKQLSSRSMRQTFSISWFTVGLKSHGCNLLW